MDGPVSIFADEGCERFFRHGAVSLENIRAASREIDPLVLGALARKAAGFLRRLDL